jgi:hypothetical protein
MLIGLGVNVTECTYLCVTELFRSKCKHAVYMEHFDVPVATVRHLPLQKDVTQNE